MKQDREFIEKQAKKVKIAPSRRSEILEEYGTIEAYLKIRNQQFAFKEIDNFYFEKLGIKSMSDLAQYTKKDLRLFGINLETLEKLEKKFGISFREDDGESELSKSGSLLSLGFTKRVNHILMRNDILTVEDFLNISEEDLKELLYDKRGRTGKAGYDTMKKVLETRSELESTSETTELESLRAKKADLITQSKGLEEQTNEAKELLTSYENLAKGTTQSDDSSSPDFKDE